MKPLLSQLYKTCKEEKTEGIQIANVEQLKLFVIYTLAIQKVQWKERDNDKTQDLTCFTQAIMRLAQDFNLLEEDEIVVEQLLNIHRNNLKMKDFKFSPSLSFAEFLTNSPQHPMGFPAPPQEREC